MSAEGADADLTTRLRHRKGEIEGAAMAKVYSVADAAQVSDPEYAEGLKLAVVAALGYGIDGLERTEDRDTPIPTVLLAQARLAARNRVKLETVLRRYLAGHTLLSQFLIEEAERDRLLDGSTLRRLLRREGVLLDRLLAAVSEEYERELESRPESSGSRRLKRIELLLAGERVETGDLGYELDAQHLALIADGRGGRDLVERLASELDCQSLVVEPATHTVWAWLGSRKQIDATQLVQRLPTRWPPALSLAAGESAEGFDGWRLSHEQARAALPLARARAKPVRYADVALLASMRRDEVLTDSLRRLYLDPLAEGHGGGVVLEDTLRAYFSCRRNISSAAAALGVNRHTVSKRLRFIEERLGRPIDACSIDLQVALKIDELT